MRNTYIDRLLITNLKSDKYLKESYKDKKLKVKKKEPLNSDEGDPDRLQYDIQTLKKHSDKNTISIDQKNKKLKLLEELINEEVALKIAFEKKFIDQYFQDAEIELLDKITDCENEHYRYQIIKNELEKENISIKCKIGYQEELINNELKHYDQYKNINKQIKIKKSYQIFILDKIEKAKKISQESQLVNFKNSEQILKNLHLKTDLLKTQNEEDENFLISIKKMIKEKKNLCIHFKIKVLSINSELKHLRKFNLMNRIALLKLNALGQIPGKINLESNIEKLIEFYNSQKIKMEGYKLMFSQINKEINHLNANLTQIKVFLSEIKSKFKLEINKNDQTTSNPDSQYTNKIITLKDENYEKQKRLKEMVFIVLKVCNFIFKNSTLLKQNLIKMEHLNRLRKEAIKNYDIDSFKNFDQFKECILKINGKSYNLIMNLFLKFHLLFILNTLLRKKIKSKYIINLENFGPHFDLGDMKNRKLKNNRKSYQSHTNSQFQPKINLKSLVENLSNHELFKKTEETNFDEEDSIIEKDNIIKKADNKNDKKNKKINFKKQYKNLSIFYSKDFYDLKSKNTDKKVDIAKIIIESKLIQNKSKKNLNKFKALTDRMKFDNSESENFSTISISDNKNKFENLQYLKKNHQDIFSVTTRNTYVNPLEALIMKNKPKSNMKSFYEKLFSNDFIEQNDAIIKKHLPNDNSNSSKNLRENFRNNTNSNIIQEKKLMSSKIFDSMKNFK